MVARIAEGDTTQWEVSEWVWEQGQYLRPGPQLVLAYLAAHAFYRADNPEGADVSQVMRQASYVKAIRRGTGLGKDAIRRAMVSLQEAGYIQREVRKDTRKYGQQPHRIWVLWDCEEMREGLRDGTGRLPSELMVIPSRPAGPERPLATVTDLGGYAKHV